MAHPRSRGEHELLAGHLRIDPGSSPLTRGARWRREIQAIVDRLIPAHAGSTALPSRKGPVMSAHPRSRGEHVGAHAVPEAEGGSSPLTRGAPAADRSRVDTTGLIPAHAGSTSSASAPTSSSPAHPRSRGEHKMGVSLSDLKAGSSPLTRGAPANLGSDDLLLGLIPAHAGSTWGPRRGGLHRRAHPRSRGEHRSRRAIAGASEGSSPLTRGARNQRQALRLSQRLIPAHAGSTVTKPTPQTATTAHPRSRGEHATAVDADTAPAGSSPLTRGARLRSASQPR